MLGQPDEQDVFLTYSTNGQFTQRNIQHDGRGRVQFDKTQLHESHAFEDGSAIENEYVPQLCTKNATMQALSNTSKQVTMCFNQSIPTMALDEAHECVSVEVPDCAVQPDPMPMGSRGRNPGTFNPHYSDITSFKAKFPCTVDKDRAESLTHASTTTTTTLSSPHDDSDRQLQSLLRAMKLQVMGNGLTESRGDQTTVSDKAPEEEWCMSTLARLLGLPDAEVDCQQQPYSVSHLLGRGKVRTVFM